MKRFFALAMCLLLMVGMVFSVSLQAQANTVNPYTEAQILDMMADSWINTCTENMKRCDDGLIIYSLGQVKFFDEDTIREVYQPLRDGLVDKVEGSDGVQINLNIEGLSKEFLSYATFDSLKKFVKVYCETRGAEYGSDEWKSHLEAEFNVRNIIRNGEIVDDVDIMDIIKENYAFFLGKASCEEALECFQEAKKTNDLAKKREQMLIGASLATFGCEMSIENTDKIVKAPYTDNEIKFDKEAQREIIADIAENAVDVVEDLVPEIGILNDVIEVTTDIGIKVLSMRGKLNALSGFLKDPNTIEGNKSAYYDALSNQYDRFTYEISDFEITMDEYKGYLLKYDAYKIVDVPEALFGFPVVAFDGVFADGLIITEITIPSTIESRNLSDVVNDCDKLEKVYYNAINCKGWYLGYFFNNCDSDFEITIGSEVKEIPERFIANCGLSDIVFPEGITKMYAGALVNCKDLKTVTIPSTVEEFEITYLTSSAVVDGCENLETVYYNAESPKGGYYNAIFSDCGNSADEMSLIFGANVKSTPATFLNNCGVKSVVFPEGMTQILEYAISDCQKLETITIPSTVVDFADNLASDYVFSGCNDLKTVNYNAKNVAGETGVTIFYDIQSDFEVRFGPEIETIPEKFISKCALSAIAFPEGVKTIRYDCLIDCDSLKTVTVPSSVETIEYNFLTKCDQVETLYFNANCTTSPNSAMISDCGNYERPAMKVILGGNVTTVPSYFIENCAITDFAYPEGIKNINKYSLINCSELETVVIPSTVEQFGYQIVDECSKLKLIEYNAINAALTTEYSGIFVNSGNADGLEIRFADNIESLPIRLMYNCSVKTVAFPDSLTAIPERAFYNCADLTSLTIHEGIVTIGNEAFYDCTGLTEIYYNAANANDLKAGQGVFASAGENGNGITVTIGAKVTKIPANLFSPSTTLLSTPKIVSVQFAQGGVCASIGKSAFANCISLPAIHIPDSVTTIGESAFYRCTGLTDVTIGKGVKTIGKTAFSQCTSLTNVSIPNGVTTIGEEVFSECIGLTSVNIGNGVTEIPTRAFKGCTGLTHVAIPSGVTKIKYSAFSGCTGLRSISVQDSVVEIAFNAFLDCGELQNVIYCGTENQWNAIKISDDGNDTLINANRQYHSWNDGVITREPTADRQGEKTFTCRICSDTKTEPVEYTAPPVPAVLDNVTITSINPHLTGNILYWNAVEHGDVYQIFRLNGTSWELLKNTRSLAFKDETAPAGVKCYYKIVARNGDSKSDIKTTASVAVTRPVPAPAKLDNVTITSINAHTSGNILYWNAVNNAKIYQVYRLDNGSWTLLTNTGSTAYKDETAPIGVKCYYKIVARNGDIKSDIATTASASATRPSTISALGNVTITKITPHVSGNILYWNAVTNAKLYQVYRLENGSWVLLKNTGSTAYKDETAPVGVKCYYKIVARNGDIKSDIATTTSASAIRPKA